MSSPSVTNKSRPRRSLSLRTPRNNKAIRGEYSCLPTSLSFLSPRFPAIPGGGETICLDSPDLFCSTPQPPAIMDTRLDPAPPIDLCSTPVSHHHNTRKRSFFTEDTGSPFIPSATAPESSLDVSGLHYQASPSLLPYTMSQEMRKVGVDVVWQWNSPKRNLDNNPQDGNSGSSGGPVARKRRKSFSHTHTHSDRPSQASSSVMGDKTGFYKIREELLRAKKEDSLFMRLLQTDEGGDHDMVNVNENQEETQIESKEAQNNIKTKTNNILNESESKEATLTRKLSDEFLNDSDNDENLLIVSQETEMKMQEEQEKKELEIIHKNKKTPTSALQNREMSFTNDSFDQYLIDIPFDELLNRNARMLDETLVTGSFTSGNVSGSAKKGLNRTQSMPLDNQNSKEKQNSNNVSSNKVGCGSNNKQNTSSSGRKSMARHESMPTTSRGTQMNNNNNINMGSTSSINSGDSGTLSKFSSVSNPSLPMSSSTESLYAGQSSLMSTSAAALEKSRVCSQTEIARKRQIAQERLKLKQKQQQTQNKIK